MLFHVLPARELDVEVIKDALCIGWHGTAISQWIQLAGQVQILEGLEGLNKAAVCGGGWRVGANMLRTSSQGGEPRCGFVNNRDWSSIGAVTARDSRSQLAR